MDFSDSVSDPMKIYRAVEAARVHVNNAKCEIIDPKGTRAETIRLLTELSDLLLELKADVSALSFDVTVSQAIDSIVYNIDAQPKEHHPFERRPDTFTPEWPKVREDYIRQVKDRLMDFFVQRGNQTYVTVGPKFFQSQARREASEVIYGLKLSS